MRKLLLAGASLFVVTPALADGDLHVVIDHDKDIMIYERIAIAKRIVADTDIVVQADKFAESFSLVNQTNVANRACSNCAEKQDWINNSFNDSSGMIGANQAIGNHNNQGNATSIAYDFDGGTRPPEVDDPRVTGGFAESQAAVSQNNGVVFRRAAEVNGALLDGSPVAVRGGPGSPLDEATESNFGAYRSAFYVPEGDATRGDLQRKALENNSFNGVTILPTDPSLFRNTIKTVNVLYRNAIVEDSFSNNSGVIHGNQAAGNMNNQANALSMAVSLENSGVALSEADLGQYTVFNEVQESDDGEVDGTPPGIRKLASIGGDSGSFNDNAGIIGFNQTTGNMANQANVVSLSSVNTGAGTTLNSAF